ncbi:MAG: glycosyltransferase family 39 protein, partial [Candidatus Bathyarchaeia archaeon]
MEKTIDKFDLVTVVILSLIFLLVATWNLGINDAPVTTWYASEGQSFYMDLGIFKKVDALYVLLKQGVMSFTVHTGYPGNWDNEIEVSFDDYNEYYKWKEIDVNVETRFIRFVFRQSYGEISEIMVWGEDGQRIVAEEIIDENGQDATLGNLIDEQEKVDLPITYMARTYFDEVYYVRTAEDYLAHRYPYEWTHPPLGKIIIIAGILVFGFNPFGWRIMGVIFATLMIPVIYFLGKKLFGTWIGAFTSAFLLVFDFMHFTMGRMATVDTYAVFFSITSHLFFFKYLQNVQKNGWETSARPLFLAFVFFSLGFATKWYVMYGFLGEIFLLLALRFKDFLKLKNGWSTKFKFLFGRPLLTLLGFILVAIAIYFLIYIPDMIAGRTLKDVWNLQWAMYKYHST